MVRAAKKVGRHGVRDRAIILLMFRHGLRTAELAALKWTQIDLAGGYIKVHRVKHGHDSIHPNELVEQEIHLNTWLLERGLARRDTQWSSRCKEPEHLVWAENIAREDKLGIWHHN